MRKIVISLSTIVAAAVAVAQNYTPQTTIENTEALDTLAMEVIETPRNLTTFKEQLTATPDSISYATVNISEDYSASQVLKKIEDKKSSNLIDGYRVGVYFNNSSTARSSALKVLAKCDSLLKDIPATMVYDNPYFKVSVGYCTNPEEAVMMLNRVQRYFPKAYLMRENIEPSQIVKAHNHNREELMNTPTTFPSTEQDHTHSLPMDYSVPNGK